MINDEIIKLENTKKAMYDAIITGGGHIDVEADFSTYVDALLERFYYINNQLISIISQ